MSRDLPQLFLLVAGIRMVDQIIGQLLNTVCADQFRSLEGIPFKHHGTRWGDFGPASAYHGPAAMQKEKIRIVVADGHSIFRDGLCRLLALEEDFEVVAQAQDGRKALEILQTCEADILLLEIKMPGLDGLATLPASS